MTDRERLDRLQVGGFKSIEQLDLLAMEIGLSAIRAACPRCDVRVTQLEQLTS